MKAYRIPPVNLDNEVAAHILGALQLAILEGAEDGLFRALGAVPLWFENVLPAGTNTDAIRLADTFPFLELFLDEAFESITDGGRMQSDIWTERDCEGKDRHLQAVAMQVGRKFLLTIESPTEAQQERTMALQRAHDVQLQAERIERMRRQLAALNEELKIRNKEVERATRAKSDFLAAMSHEIRTPMNAIIGMADLLQQTALSAEQKKYVDVFQRAGENLLVLINDILDLAKVESGKIELESVDFDLFELVSNVVDIVQVKAQTKGLTVAHRIETGVPTALVGDPNRLRQVLLNLIGNSIKFTEKGGVEIRVGLDSESGTGGRLHFVIADTGIGIPEDKLGTIFESFSQADTSTTRKYGGTGLGLSISRQLIGLMQGRIWVESELGFGSKFHFTATFVPQANPWRTQASQRGQQPGTVGLPGNPQVEPMPSGLRILLADDSEDNRFLIISYLKGTAGILDIAVDGRIAVEKFGTRSYDLVLMDVEMPEMDGYTAVRTIRQMHQNKAQSTPILALTAHAFPEALAKSLEAGFTDHLVKPIRRATLLDSIRKYAPATQFRVPDQVVQVLIDPLLVDMVPGFLEKRRRDALTLAEAVAAGDYETVRKIGHNLKGTGTGYGFSTISDIGAQIEEAAIRQDQANIQNNVEALNRYLSSVQWSTASSNPVEG